jgi:2-dehydropantoate 2-reductase
MAPGRYLPLTTGITISGDHHMRTIIIGAGGVGGYFGAALAGGGHEVTLFARGAHRDAVRERGLTIRGPGGERVVRVGATDDPRALPDADLALVAVKGYSLPEVIPAVRLAAERGADVLPLLNGVSAADELIAGGVPRARLLGGIARISAARTEPGVIELRSSFASIVLGEFGGGMSERAERIVATLRAAGIDARATDRIEVELWQKLVFIASLAAVCGLAGASIGPARDAPHGPRIVERAVHEVVAVARARGVALPEDEATRTTTYILSLPSEMKPSFLLDLENGGPTELELLSGAVVRYSAEAGLDCPVHETAYAALSVRQRGPAA